MFEKLKSGWHCISELQESIEKHFQNELSMFKAKCEKLVSKSYANRMVHIEKLKKEIKNKDQIINHLLFSLKTVSCYPDRRQLFVQS